MHIPPPVISIISFITPSVNSEGAPRAASRVPSLFFWLPSIEVLTCDFQVSQLPESFNCDNYMTWNDSMFLPFSISQVPAAALVALSLTR